MSKHLPRDALRRAPSHLNSSSFVPRDRKPFVWRFQNGALPVRCKWRAQAGGLANCEEYKERASQPKGTQAFATFASTSLFAVKKDLLTAKDAKDSRRAQRD